MSFDPVTELARLRQQAAITRKTSLRRRTSRLDRYTSELLELHQAGASTANPVLAPWPAHSGGA